MKNKIEVALFCLVCFAFFGFFAFGNNVTSYYSVEGAVSAIEEDKIIITDTTGETWEFYGKGYQVDDEIKIKFCTNGTDETREDDKVIKVEKI
jgi:hypothetical protein